MFGRLLSDALSSDARRREKFETIISSLPDDKKIARPAGLQPKVSVTTPGPSRQLIGNDL